VDPDNPAANMQKYMMYIAPFFALSGLYWQFGLVLYWVTTNIWTLGQQHILFRNLPIVGSDTVGASAAPATTGNSVVSSKSSAAGKATAGKSAGTARPSGTAAKPGGTARPSGTAAKSATAGKSSAAAKSSAASKGSGSASGKTSSGSAKPVSANANANASNGANGGTTESSSRGLLRGFGKKSEPEPVPAAPQTKVVRQQPSRQTRSKRGNSGKR
jgi:hypothetical protein